MSTFHSIRRGVLFTIDSSQTGVVSVIHPNATFVEDRRDNPLPPWTPYPVWDVPSSMDAQAITPHGLAPKGYDPGEPFGVVSSPYATTVVPSLTGGTISAAEKMSYNEENANSFHSIPKIYQLDVFWKGPYVAQKMYEDSSASRRKRLAQDLKFSETALFATTFSYGVLLDDSLDSEVLSIIGSQQQVLQENKCSISIRIEWPGYHSWSRQVPTRDYCKIRKPITLAKFATEIKKVVRLFIEKNKDVEMDVDADPQWSLRRFTVDDLVLVSAHHVSRGSWQPHLRLRFPLEMYPLY